MSTTRYRGFEIVTRSYQLAEGERWTLDFVIRRGGRGRSFSLSEDYATQEEAEAQCIAVGRRIIEGRVKGWSVEDLRQGESPIAALVRMATGDSVPVLIAVAAILGIGLFVLREVR